MGEATKLPAVQGCAYQAAYQLISCLKEPGTRKRCWLLLTLASDGTRGSACQQHQGLFPEQGAGRKGLEPPAPAGTSYRALRGHPQLNGFSQTFARARFFHQNFSQLTHCFHLSLLPPLCHRVPRCRCTGTAFPLLPWENSQKSRFQGDFQHCAHNFPAGNTQKTKSVGLRPGSRLPSTGPVGAMRSAPGCLLVGPDDLLRNSSTSCMSLAHHWGWTEKGKPLQKKQVPTSPRKHEEGYAIWL